MKRFLPFVAILLATLSMINADFVQCPTPPVQNYAVELNISVSPNPISQNTDETLTISGSLEKQLTPDYKLVITFTDGQGIPLATPAITEICNVYYKCPIDAYAPITLNKCVVSPNQQLTSYGVIVTISQITDPPDILGCAVELVGVSPKTFSVDTALNYINSYVSSLSTSSLSDYPTTDSC